MTRTKYNLSITRIIKRLRQIYLKPIVSLDPTNSHEALDITFVETQLKQLGAVVEPYTVDWKKFLDQSIRWPVSAEMSSPFLSAQFMMQQALFASLNEFNQN